MVLPVGDHAAQQVGRRRNGESAGVRPPSVRWLPPPVPECRPSSSNFSVPSPSWRASSSRPSARSTSSSQVALGWMFTSITPGSGVTLSERSGRHRSAGSPRRPPARRRSRPAASTTAMSSTVCAASVSGGRNTRGWPSRSSTQSAVGGGPSPVARSARASSRSARRGRRERTRWRWDQRAAASGEPARLRIGQRSDPSQGIERQAEPIGASPGRSTSVRGAGASGPCARSARHLRGGAAAPSRSDGRGRRRARR